MDGIVSVVVQLGVKKSPDIPADVPLALDLREIAEDRQVLEDAVRAERNRLYPSFMGPCAEGARRGDPHWRTQPPMTDPEFIDTVIKSGLDLDPDRGRRADRSGAWHLALPEAAVARARELLPAQ